MHDKSLFRAIASKMCASGIYSITNGLVKFMNNIGIYNIIVYQNIIAIFFLFTLIKFKKYSLKTQKLKIHLIRSFFYSIGTILWFYSITKLPISTCVMISAISPIFTIFASVVFLKEKCSLKRFMIIITGMFGSFLIISHHILNTQNVQMNFYVFFPVIANIIYSFCNILSRKMKSENPVVMSFYMLLFSFPILFTFFPYVKFSSYTSVLLIVLTGFLAALAYTLMNVAYSLKEVTLLIPFGLIKPILGCIVGMCFFNEKINYLQFLGMLIAIIAIQLAHSYEKKLHYRQSEK